MSSRLSLLCAAALLALSGSASLAAQDKLDVKKALQAGKTAQDQDKFADALAAYGQVLDSQDKTAVRYRPDALYGAVVAGVAAPGDAATAGKVKGWIDELTTKFPAFGHRGELSAARRVVDLTERQAAERAALTTERDAAVRAREACTADAAAASKQLATAQADLKAAATKAPDVDPLRGVNQQLREELTRTRAELEKTNAELRRKDQALKKVTGALMTPKL